MNPPGADTAVPGDWVVVPFRLLEAARISLYTVSSHPDLPEDARVYIAQWINTFNIHLSAYFEANYVPGIFEVLAKISGMVRDASEEMASENHENRLEETFRKWEEQFGGDGNGGGEQPPSPDSPAPS